MIADLQEVVRGLAPGMRVLPVAGGSKPGLSRSGREDVIAVDLSGLTGIVEYDPAELTITARAGTPVHEVHEVLAAHGQYLPFDPPFAAAGATLGGTVAAGACGPCALRHGGIRDFVIGVEFIDGDGDVIRGGGKVVKNAAGFDLPKLMVGSAGRLGLITQLSFKVFPRPPATATLRFETGRIEDAVGVATVLFGGPVGVDALDITPGGTVLARVGGRAGTLDARLERLAGVVDVEAVRVEGDGEAARAGGMGDGELWRDAAEFSWLPAGSQLVRVALPVRRLARFDAALAAVSGVQVRYSLGGVVAWVAWPAGRSLDELDALLHAHDLPGMVLVGTPGRGLLGPATGGAFGRRVTQALDPHNRFLEL